MHYHILLTELCNSQCRYCYQKSFKEFGNNLDKIFKFDFSEPVSSEVSLKKLKDFLAKDKEAVLIFYGGEPLLEIKKIKKIIDGVNVPFRMQTNGKLLNELPAKYTNKISKILISIDGCQKRTDYNKGIGTYDLLMKNLKLIKKNGYKGELIARMTISPEFPDIFEQVKHLISLGLFEAIHWQIDCGFYKFDYNKKKFEEFAKNYNNSIRRLINYWFYELKRGKVIRLYPFLAIVESLLKKENTKLRCGAGHSGYAITTNGKIVACPIMNCIVDFEAGTLKTEPSKLKKFCIGGSCCECDYKNLCGGRCLYWNKTKLWPAEGNELICKTIKNLIDELKKKLHAIDKLIKSGIIKSSYFEYEKYFGPEIIP